MAYRTWIDDPRRHTLDIDVAVAMDLDDFDRLTRLLHKAGWTQEGQNGTPLDDAEGVRIDLLPAGPKMRERGILEWPVSGMRMSLTGFEHVFRDSILATVAPEFKLEGDPPACSGTSKNCGVFRKPASPAEGSRRSRGDSQPLRAR